jgi:hypothetical protein
VPQIDSSLNLAPTKTLVGGRVHLMREHDEDLREGSDENILESSTNSKQGKVEQRFLMPCLRFNLISSIGDVVNLPDTMS